MAMMTNKIDQFRKNQSTAIDRREQHFRLTYLASAESAASVSTVKSHKPTQTTVLIAFISYYCAPGPTALADCNSSGLG